MIMKYLRVFKILMLILFSVCTYACTTDNEIETNDVNEGDNTQIIPKDSYDISSIISKLTESENVDYEIIGDYVYIYTTGVPDHKSPYFLDTDLEDTMYEGYAADGFRLNPNRIAALNYEFRIPLYPTVTSQNEATPMGPMGFAINGVPFYNQYAAGGVDLTNEFFSFDKYNGHPARLGNYHYHIEPVYLTEKKGEDALVGILLDGFPVYGPLENEDTITSDDLDEFHGHFGVTIDFPEGIYHYHTTADAPYINGNGFYGVPGTVSN